MKPALFINSIICLVLPDIAQLVERSTVDRLVTCSNQVGGIYFVNESSLLVNIYIIKKLNSINTNQQ